MEALLKFNIAQCYFDSDPGWECITDDDEVCVNATDVHNTLIKI